MSGEAGGLILIPLAIGVMPYILGGLAIAGAVNIGLKVGVAAVDYERRRKQRNEIQHSRANKNIGNFRSDIKDLMYTQTQSNIKTSEEMMKELEAQREAVRKAAEEKEISEYQNYVASIKNLRIKSMKKISDAQIKFNSSYRQKISRSMADISQKISVQYENYMNEISMLQNDSAAKNKKAEEIASSYIEEAKSVLKSLTEDFNGEKFSPLQLKSLNEQFNEAVKMFNKGRYESAVASAKDVVLSTLEEIFEADAKNQERENYLKLSLVLAEEVKTYLESNSIITEEAKKFAEKNSGVKLEDEIVGINIADYTEKNSKGEKLFDVLKAKADEIFNALNSKEAEKFSTEQLKSYAEFLNSELYPSAVQCVNKAIINMNNAFSRQNISEELIDFFEEHNFTFSGYAYDEGQHDKALHIGVENQSTGEELIITLAPETLDNGDIQTHIDLKQIKGDEANEERKAYYRECVEEVVKGKTPQAKINIKCNAATRNKLSSDTETKKKLRR